MSLSGSLKLGHSTRSPLIPKQKRLLLSTQPCTTMELYAKTLPTLPSSYKDYTYWIDGIPETALRYYVQSPHSEKPVASEELFTSVVAANFAARSEIDKATGVKEAIAPEETDTVSESPKAPKTTRRRAKA